MKIIKKIFVLIAILVSTVANSSQISVAVSANVGYAFIDIKKEFNKIYPNIKIYETLASSGQLTAQIRNGANYVIFLAANMKYPDALYEDGLSSLKPVVYARGSLAYLSNKKQNYSKGISLLMDKKNKKIAIANPKTAPYGKACVQAMINSKIYNEIKDKIVYAQNAAQVVTYALSSADIGLVAKSSLFSENMKRYKRGIDWFDVDQKLYEPINQGMVLLKNGEKNSDAKAFYEFILSKKAEEIFKSYGYSLP